MRAPNRVLSAPATNAHWLPPPWQAIATRLRPIAAPSPLYAYMLGGTGTVNRAKAARADYADLAMARVDSILSILVHQGANELRLGTDREPRLLAHGAARRLSIPVTPEETLRELLGEI